MKKSLKNLLFHYLVKVNHTLPYMIIKEHEIKLLSILISTSFSINADG